MHGVRMTSKKLVCGVLGALMMLLAGCQSVGGLNVNKVIVNNLSIKSSEANESISIELIPSETFAVTKEQKAILDAFQSMKLTFRNIVVQDPRHVSFQGEFSYGKGQIPFQLSLANNDIVVHIEGAKKPIVIHNNAEFGKSMTTLSAELQTQLAQLQEKSSNLVPVIGSFFVNNAPNPKKINVSSVTETVYGESLNLQKLHMEIYGNELADLVKTMLTNLAADEKGMKEMLGSVYDLVFPVLQEMVKSQDIQDDSMSTMIMTYLNNKTLAVEFAYSTIQGLLKNALGHYDDEVSKMLASDQGLKDVLSEKAYMKIDYFVDNDLFTRKSTIEFSMPLPEGGNTGIKGLKISGQSEKWNINKPVTAASLDASGEKIEFGAGFASSRNKGKEFLGAFDKDSTAYKLFKEDLHIGRQEIRFWMDRDGNVNNIDDSLHPYIKNGVTLVPVRFVAKKFGTEVKWDADAQQVIIADHESGTQIKLAIGNNTAWVNGEQKPLETEVELTNGTTFVPLRFISEALGAKVNWNNELRMITITKD